LIGELGGINANSNSKRPHKFETTKEEELQLKQKESTI
jgi:hypothetical protein